MGKPYNYDSGVLDTLKALLQSCPKTALQLTVEMACSNPTVYSRIEALKARGTIVVVTEGKSTRRGPPPRTFTVALDTCPTTP